MAKRTKHYPDILSFRVTPDERNRFEELVKKNRTTKTAILRASFMSHILNK
jgi:hypothetical protein